MEGEGTDDEDAISRFEETVVLQAASALFVKPPATLANTGTSAHGAGKGLTVLAGIGHAAAVDQEAVNAILNSDDRDSTAVDTRKGGYLYDSSTTPGHRRRFGRKEVVQQLGKWSAGEWSAGEILGLCKAVDMNGRRLEGVDMQLAALLVPTRSPETIATQLLAFRLSYAEYKQRRLDRSLRNQAAAPSPRKPTKKSKRRKFAVDEGTGGRGDGATGANSGSAAAPRDSDDDHSGDCDDAAGRWAAGEVTALVALLSAPKSLSERRAALDMVLSQTEMGAAPINVEARKSTLDQILDRQETTEDKISRLDEVLDQQATE